jgi:hypothetical protein
MKPLSILIGLIALFATGQSLAQSMTVCQQNQAPVGWVSTAKLSSPSCVWNTAYVMEVPQNNLKICYYSKIPSGWVSVQKISGDFACGNSGAPASNPVIVQAYNYVETCGDSPIPSGWVVVGKGTAAACGNGNPYSSRILKIPGNVERVCNDSPVPAGYRFIGNAGGGCGNFNSWGTIYISR